ncbi:hypothetical protein HMP06_2213 [Sphingomonas sp. HMP6]|nr:hypothetical protein HMP06_2213 [Sphingomonas sp. HMP6]
MIQKAIIFCAGIAPQGAEPGSVSGVSYDESSTSHNVTASCQFGGSRHNRGVNTTPEARAREVIDGLT